MGMAKVLFPMLKQAIPPDLGGTVLMYGVQNTDYSAEDVRRVFTDRIAAHGEPEHGSENGNAGIDSRTFFRMLGFDQVAAMDMRADEGADYLENLAEDLPDTYHGRFDLIYDGGTLEHIFNVPKALENGVRMLKPGGVVVHHLPINDHIEHGYYQFSPGLLMDYYVANGFVDCAMYFDLPGKGVLRYGPHDILPRSMVNKQGSVLFSARKTTVEEIKQPIQRMYLPPHTKFLAQEIGRAPFYVWGVSGGFTKGYLPWFQEWRRKLNFLGFLDSDEDKQKESYLDSPVLPPSVLESAAPGTVVLLASTHYQRMAVIIDEMDRDLRIFR